MEITELIESFIVDEEQAMKKDIQGKFYPNYHNKIKPLLSKPLNEVSDDNKIKLFYYLFFVNKGVYFLPNKKNFELFKEALIRFLTYSEAENLNIDQLSAYVLFGTDQLNEVGIIKATTFEDYKKALKMVNQCNKYSSLRGICDKQDKFIPFSENEFSINQAIIGIKNRGIQRKAALPSADFLFWGLLLILIQSENQDVRSVLNDLVRKKEHREYIYVFGGFLGAITQNVVVLELKKELYIHHPKEWIEEKDENWLLNYYKE